MGYRGLVRAQERARELRAEAWTLDEIAAELDVAKSSVSLWVRDVEFDPRPRRSSARRPQPNALQRAKAAEIERLLVEGRQRIGALSERDFLVAGTALYAGEGFKVRQVGMANIRRTKHEMGCPRVSYTCSHTHRAVLGLVEALVSLPVPFRGSSVGRAPDC